MVKGFEEALKRIEELEQTVENQKILIDALVGQIKNASKRSDAEEAPSPTAGKKAEGVDARKQEEGMVFSSEVEAMFRSKKGRKAFRENFVFEDFVKFNAESHSFSLNARGQVTNKSPVKAYLALNLDKLLCHLVSNANELSINALCSSLNAMSGEISYGHKLVVAHDLLLFMDDLSKFPFAVSALFNNQGVRDDVLGRSIKAIVAQQCTIDQGLHKEDPHLVSCYRKIRSNFDLRTNDTPIKDLLNEVAEDIEVFKDGEINQAVYFNMYALRMLCHYMDWDYTYNTFIRGGLYPRFEEHKEPAIALYILTLALNALRVFGRIESVMVILEEMSRHMLDDSDLSVLLYLFIRQVDPRRANEWLRLNGPSVSRHVHPDGLVLF
jgi:hypothetical protein